MEISVILFLLLGLALVVIGSDALVEGASDIARRSGISEFVIGLTIVGIGTSMPEFVVSIIGSIQGKSDIAIGNVIGSNIFNTFLILGITSLILPMAITQKCLKRDIPVNIAATLMLILLGFKKSVFGVGSDSLTRIDGFIFLVCFALYLYSSFKDGKDDDAEMTDDNVRKYPSVAISILLVLGGLAGLVFGGRIFVNNAVIIAGALGLSDKFIAITILAGGTSLPELATCVAAAVKKKGQLALGNIIGSNISNIFLILGGSALIHPLSMENITHNDLGFLILSSFFLLVANFTFFKKKLDRPEGAVMLLMEAAYMYILINEIN